MSGIRTNLTSLSEEVSEISASLQEIVDTVEEIIRNIQASFDEGQLPEVDALVTSYYELEGDLEEFNREVDKLVNILNGQYEPDSLDEIEAIERTCEVLIQSVTRFRDCCKELATTFSGIGLNDKAAALKKITSAIDKFPEAIRELVFDNYLVLAVKAEYFPESLSNEVSELIVGLESTPAEQRQNIYAILAMIADEYPVAVARYTDPLAKQLMNEDPAAQQNLLAILMLIAESEQDAHIAKEQALNLLSGVNPGVSAKAAALLVEQPLTADEANQVATRMITLLDENSDQTVRTNLTFVLYSLAASHPDVLREDTSDIASCLNDPSPGVVENTIGTLGRLGCTKYADRISEIRANSDDPEVRAEAQEALQQFDTTN